MFLVISSSGALMTARGLDADTGITHYELVIFAIDSGTEPRTASGTIIVNIQDENDAASGRLNFHECALVDLVCVCVCVCARARARLCACVCVCVRESREREREREREGRGVKEFECEMFGLFLLVFTLFQLCPD